MSDPAGQENRSEAGSTHKRRDWLLNHLLFDAVLLIAISTAVSIFVTEWIRGDPAADFANFRMALAAQQRADKELLSLSLDKSAAQSPVYRRLFKKKFEADDAYEEQDWIAALADYESVSNGIEHECLTGGRNVRRLCAAVRSGFAARLYPARLASIVPGSPTLRERETVRHAVNTFADFHTLAGEGEPIRAGQYVRVSCKVKDPSIPSVSPEGYWYRIASAPWNNQYFAPANTFLNGDQPQGPYRHDTDFKVANCRSVKS